jgi:hypothetical protein
LNTKHEIKQGDRVKQLQVEILKEQKPRQRKRGDIPCSIDAPNKFSTCETLLLKAGTAIFSFKSPVMVLYRYTLKKSENTLS